jgi:hypothetical protein
MAMAEPTAPARWRCGTDCALLPPLAGVGVEVAAATGDATESNKLCAAAVGFCLTREPHSITDVLDLSSDLREKPLMKQAGTRSANTIEK